MDSDAVRDLKVLLEANQEAVEKLAASTSELAKVIVKVDGKSTTDKPLDTEALVKALSEGLTSAMKPLITEMSRNAGMGGAGGPGDGGGKSGGGGGGADMNQTLASIAVAQAITGDLKKLQKSTRELFSISASFRDARVRQIQTLESIVGSLHQSVVGLLSGAELLTSFQEQWRESRENTERGLGGMIDTWFQNLRGSGDVLSGAANTFAGGAISFSQAVELIKENQGFFGRFEGGRVAFSREISRLTDRIETSLQARGESIYDFQTGEQFRQMAVATVALYGLNAQQAEEASVLRRIDGAIQQKIVERQLEFARLIARNTGRTVDEVIKLQPPEETLELAMKAGLGVAQSEALGRIMTVLQERGMTSAVGDINAALRGMGTGRGIAEFESGAIVRGRAQAATSLVNSITDETTNEDILRGLRTMLLRIDASNSQSMNLIDGEFSLRQHMDTLDFVNRLVEDQADSQNTFFEGLTRGWDDFFRNNALGQMLTAGAGVFGSIVTATNLNTTATIGLTLQMGARGLMGTIRNLPNMFGNMFQRVLAVLGMRRGAASLVDDSFDALGGASRVGRTAAVGAGGLRGLLGGLGKAGGVGFILTGLLGLFDGTGSQFTDALGENGQAAFADFTSNLLKLILGGVLIAVGGIPAAIIGGVAFLLDRAFDFFNLGKLFGLSEDAGLFDAIGIGLTNLGNMLGNWFSNLPFFESITNAVGGFFGGIARFLGIMEDDVEEQAEDAEAELDRVNSETEQNVTRIIMAANETRRVVFPESGEQHVIDINRAAAALRNSGTNEQMGMSDAEMLLALRRGGELQADQVRVLLAIERELRRDNGRNVIFDTDPTVRGVRQR